MSKHGVNINFAAYQPLSTTRLYDGQRQLNRDYHIEVDGTRYTVKKGFKTDFSSYPWYARVIVRFDKVDVAGVVHDWLYCTGEVNRAQADKIWRQVAMAGQNHANALQAWLSWLGLRIGGWVSWQNYRREANSNCH